VLHNGGRLKDIVEVSRHWHEQMIFLPVLLIAVAAQIFGASSAVSAPKPYGCFVMHGFLAADVGHPTFRISPKTKDGLIALAETDASGTWLDPLPPNVRELFQKVSQR
jgi:hypothetical protein